MSGPDCAETFRQEAQDLLEQLEQALLDLERAPGDGELVNSAFRALHTIKGSGSMFGFEAVAKFAHGFETAFDQVRKGLAPTSPDLVAAALAAKDHIRTLIERPQDADPALEASILGKLSAAVARPAATDAESVAHGGAPADQSTTAEGPTTVTWRIRFRLPREAMINGTNPLLLLDELRELGTCRVEALTNDIPPLDELQPEHCYLGWDVTLTTDRPRAAIEEVFIFVLDDAELEIAPLADIAAQADAIKPAASIAAKDDAARGAVTGGRFPHDAGADPAVPSAGRNADPSTATQMRKFAPRQGEGRRETDNGSTSSIRVQAERLDELMDRVGELVIAQARLTQLASSNGDVNIKSVAEDIERLSAGLRDTTMGIRMLPIGSLFGRFRRLVHDLSRDLGKEVELITAGEETELDKTMIERLADPLVHLIRNAIDHGLERPEDRAGAGKSPSGRVRLTARYAGAQVLIAVGDDGRGLDRERIRAKAEENGLIAPGTPLADAELFQFLFHPGFSTAREVSAVSGRGVGMDVVKRTIEGLRGSIDLSSVPGEGSEVTLRLPLTLAIIDGLLVRVGAARYAIPLAAVEECVELSQADDSRSQHRSFMNIRGDLVPFLRLRELLGTSGPPDPYQKVVVVSSGELRVGLVVDQIIGSHQTVIKSLSRLHADVETFSGATILGDGTVALIFDIAHLVEAGQASERDNIARREAA